MSGVLAFTASNSSRESRKILLSNFDASYALGAQQDEYQVLICTDALSEGVNLHRAGIIFNYDIPYNPTRVVQRIGRINRINKKVFDVIHIYNFFPTVIGNSIISIKSIATLKKALINSIMGDDVRALTPDENLETFFMEEFVAADEGKEDLSWDSVFMEEYENAIKSQSLLKKVEQIPRRSRISRTLQQRDLGLVFSKRGQNSIFMLAEPDGSAEVLSTEEALKLFKAEPHEEGAEISPKFQPLFKAAREKLEAKHELPVIKGRRNDALNLLEALRLQLPAASSYCVDLIKIIRDLDDIDEGTLKDLAQIREKSPDKIFQIVKAAIPESHVRNILARVQRMEDEAQTILLAEEFQK
jgi:superfamily II DNA/RNA helicase